MSLHDLCIKYNSDKCNEAHTHRNLNYIHIYEKYFEKYRYNIKSILEIGVRDGASIKMWKEYFPNAIIYGIDIDPRCKSYEDDRIKIFIGDQNNADFLNTFISQITNDIDIIIDDGSHIIRHQIQSFNLLYPLLNKMYGLYIIEDLHCSYEELHNQYNIRELWPGMIYNDPKDNLKNYRIDFDNFIKNKVKSLDFFHEKYLYSIHHYPLIVIFENYTLPS